MPTLTLVQAVNDALRTAMREDPSVVVLGEDVGPKGGVFLATEGLTKEFGEERCFDTPLSEDGIVGAAIGMALNGLKPVAEIQFQDFLFPALGQIVSEAAKFRYRSGGQYTCPMVIRTPYGGGIRGGLYHSQSGEAYFCHVPGLKVVQPSTPYDAKGLLLSAIDDPDPVMVFEHKLLYKMKGDVPEAAYRVPIGKAAVRREGRHVTLVATAIMVHRALEAAETLVQEGIEAEVIDLRSLRPLDTGTIIESVKKTSRLASIYEGVKTLGIGAEISAMIAESEAFDYLDAPILRLGGAEAPIPYNPVLEKAAVPQT